MDRRAQTGFLIKEYKKMTLVAENLVNWCIIYFGDIKFANAF